MSRISELHLTIREALIDGLQFNDIVKLVGNEYGLTDINFIRTMIDVVNEQYAITDEDD